MFFREGHHSDLRLVTAKAFFERNREAHLRTDALNPDIRDTDDKPLSSDYHWLARMGSGDGRGGAESRPARHKCRGSRTGRSRLGDVRVPGLIEGNGVGGLGIGIVEIGQLGVQVSVVL